MIGKTISHYKIIEKLGEGGMGVVYKAQDTKLDRVVALKFLPAHLTKSDSDKARFLQEAKAAAALNHNNVCTIHEIHDEGENPFIVMEYVKGKTLRKIAGESKALPLEDVTSYAIQIADALKVAHKENIIHRDIKSENIMVMDNGQIKVMDFGLAKLRGSVKLTKSSSTVGTVAYMSPEHIEGKDVDARTDIFSFGVVLYEMLSGRLPFKGDYDSAMMYAIVNEAQEPIQKHRSDLSSEFLHVMDRALEKNPEERYQSVNDMLIDLKRLERDTGRVIREAFAGKADEKVGKKKGKARLKWLYASAAILLLALAVYLIRPDLFKIALKSEPVSIAIIHFENQTGESSLDILGRVIPNLLITSLEESKHFRVMTLERLYDFLKQMGKEHVEFIDNELGFELCKRAGVQAIVLGSFAKAGDVFVVDAKVQDVNTKELLKGARSQGKGEASILETQVDALSREISRGIGLSEKQIDSNQRNVANMTTTSLEAYEYYIKGEEAGNKYYFIDARKFLEKAVKLDSTFLLAYRKLSEAYSWLQDFKAANEAMEKAERFLYKATRKERLLIEAENAWSDDPMKAERLYRQALKDYPHETEIYRKLSIFLYGHDKYDEAIKELERYLEVEPEPNPDAYNNLGYWYQIKGNFEKAEVFMKKYIEIVPDQANPYDSMGDLQFVTGRIDEALINYKESIRINDDLFSSTYGCGYIYALKENYTAALDYMDRYARIAPSEGLKADSYLWKGFLNAWLGRRDQALEDFRRVKELARTVEVVWYESVADWFTAWIYLDKDDTQQSRRHLDTFFNKVKEAYPRGIDTFNMWYHLPLGFIDLEEGQIDSAESQLAKLETLMESIEPIWKNYLWYYTLSGEILLAQNRIEEAIVAFREVPRQDNVIPFIQDSETIRSHNPPFLMDGLARAYVQKGELDKAIEEYERLITFDPDRLERWLIRPQYHHRLAKLYEEKGWPGKAIEEYKKFLEIWQDADKDLPEPHDARARLAKLKR